MIQNLKRDGKNPLFYYASHRDIRSLEFRNILGSLLKQVLDASLLPADYVQELIKSSTALDEDSITDALRAAVERNANLFCVIDGLEECQKDDQRRMMETISLLSGHSCHILLTCREEGQLWRFLNIWSSIKLDEQFLSDDIEAFTRSSVSKEVAAGNLMIADEDQKKFVIEELIHRSHGMCGFDTTFLGSADIC